MFRNIKVITKSGVFFQPCRLQLDNFAENYVICHELFCTVACLFVSYVYLKYVTSDYLKDFCYENSENEILILFKYPPPALT